MLISHSSHGSECVCVCGEGGGRCGGGLGMRLGGMVPACTWSELPHKHKCLLGPVEDEDSYAAEIRSWKLAQNRNHSIR